MVVRDHDARLMNCNELKIRQNATLRAEACAWGNCFLVEILVWFECDLGASFKHDSDTNIDFFF